MRNIFAQTLDEIANSDKSIVFLTGDLGFNAFENLQSNLENRFINAGVAEHNMITVASGLAYTGLKPWIYSIAPFVSIKVLEEIRNDICLHNANVKIVGLGGGYDYGFAGPTHHALQDVAAILTLPNIKVFTPGFIEDIPKIIKKMYQNIGPEYLRLTKGEPTSLALPQYSACRRILKGSKATVIVLGSIIKQVVGALDNLPNDSIDLWLVSEMPLKLPEEFYYSIKKTKTACVIEEHVKTGALGQFLSQDLIEKRILPSHFTHLYAKGYKTKYYGSQDFYLRQTGLDKDSIAKELKRVLSKKLN